MPRKRTPPKITATQREALVAIRRWGPMPTGPRNDLRRGGWVAGRTAGTLADRGWARYNGQANVEITPAGEAELDGCPTSSARMENA